MLGGPQVSEVCEMGQVLFFLNKIVLKLHFLKVLLFMPDEAF